MGCYVLGFQEIDQTQVAVVGGKGALLAELSRIADIRVPPGLCVSTDAFRRILAAAPSIDDRLAPLARLAPEEGEAMRAPRNWRRPFHYGMQLGHEEEAPRGLPGNLGPNPSEVNQRQFYRFWTELMEKD